MDITYEHKSSRDERPGKERRKAICEKHPNDVRRACHSPQTGWRKQIVDKTSAAITNRNRQQGLGWYCAPTQAQMPNPSTAPFPTPPPLDNSIIRCAKLP